MKQKKYELKKKDQKKKANSSEHPKPGLIPQTHSSSNPRSRLN
jgi:hypothetical protein